MAAFFSTQLDFIFFFYGLAFILLGSICLAVARGPHDDAPWRVLATFGFLHGGSEWLDLLALIAGDAPAFAVLRTGIMTASFIVLLEFARLEGMRLGLKVPGRWIYVPLLLLVGCGAYLSGLSGANVFARYALGLTGAGGTSLVLYLRIRNAQPAEKRWIAAAVIGFALYAVAAGAVVPPTPDWAGDAVNYDDFSLLTGMPIQFVRGLLACWIAFSIWGYWGQRLMREVASQRYSKFMQRQFVWTLAAMGTILVFGWVMTEYLGDIYKENVQQEALGDLDLISSRLNGETASVDNTVRILAGSGEIRALLSGRDKVPESRANSILRLDSDVSGARAASILNRDGAVVASFSRAEPAEREDFAQAPFVLTALAGASGQHFAVGAAGKSRDYYASYPVHDEDGEVIGAAVLKKSLDGFAADLSRFDVSYFLVDPHGIVVITNRPESQYRTLWPLEPGTVAALTPRYGAINTSPLLPHEFTGAIWDRLGGVRDYVQRRPVDQGGWSLVTAMPPQGIFVSRVLGIIITLQMTTLALLYLVGRERSIHDNVQLQKRVDLEALARDLDRSATTDPLTGLYNRRKFNRELAIEMLRSQRYHKPLSLVLFDVDRFKLINDSFGHPTGDAVLVELARLVSGSIRASDVLARWGGEEFVILAPGIGADEARQFAVSLAAAVRNHAMDEVGPITCSFGIAQFEMDDTPESLIARVDEALYRAKVNGRDRAEVAPRPVVAAPDLVPLG